MTKDSDLDTQAIDDFRLITQTRQELSLPSTCKSCYFFKHGATYSKKCEQLGVMAESPPCKRIMPILTDLSPIELENLAGIFPILSQLTDTQWMAVMLMMRGTNKNDSRKFRPGMSCYALISGEDQDYWAPAFVAYASRDGMVKAITVGTNISIMAKESAFSITLPEGGKLVPSGEDIIVVDAEAEIERERKKNAKEAKVLRSRKAIKLQPKGQQEKPAKSIRLA